MAEVRLTDARTRDDQFARGGGFLSRGIRARNFWRRSWRGRRGRRRGRWRSSCSSGLVPLRRGLTVCREPQRRGALLSGRGRCLWRRVPRFGHGGIGRGRRLSLRRRWSRRRHVLRHGCWLGRRRCLLVADPDQRHGNAHNHQQHRRHRYRELGSPPYRLRGIWPRRRDRFSLPFKLPQRRIDRRVKPGRAGRRRLGQPASFVLGHLTGSVGQDMRASHRGSE